MFKKYLLFAFLLFSVVVVRGQWQDLSLSQSSDIRDVDFFNENVGLTVRQGEVLRTVNGGKDWEVVHRESSQGVLEDIVVVGARNVYAVGQVFENSSTRGIILKSENQGVSWTRTVLPDYVFLRSVYFPLTEVGYACGSGGKIYRTVDGGEAWEECESPTTETLLSIHFVDSQTGYAVGGLLDAHVALKTTDGGETWEELMLSDVSSLQSVFFLDPMQGYIAGWDGVIVKTEDGGKSWERQTSVNMYGNMEVLFLNDSTGYIVGGTSIQTSIQKTDDGGRTWRDISPMIAQGLLGMCFLDERVGYVCGAAGTLLKTRTGGEDVSGVGHEADLILEVYPNPTTDRIRVGTSEDRNNTSIELWTMGGKRLMLQENVDAFEWLDLSDLVDGHYLLRIRQGEKEGSRIIVKR